MIVEVIELVDDEEQVTMHHNVTSIVEADGVLLLGVGEQPSDNDAIHIPVDTQEGRAIAVKIVIA